MTPRPPLTRPPLTRLVVVVPVHDEEDLLPACLASVAAAREAVDLPVDVVVVLDDCRDGSARIARATGCAVLEVRHRAVGAARAAGVRHALALADEDPATVWVASTDADSVVPADWLAVQRALADDGTDVVVGTVTPDPRDLTTRQLAAWSATRVPGRPNGHVHGANLGVRADAYLRAGGFATLPEHEDVDLVSRLRTDPRVDVRASDAADVLTSGRTSGRTPGGYAGYLRASFPP